MGWPPSKGWNQGWISFDDRQRLNYDPQHPMNQLTQQPRNRTKCKIHCTINQSYINKTNKSSQLQSGSLRFLPDLQPITFRSRSRASIQPYFTQRGPRGRRPNSTFAHSSNENQRAHGNPPYDPRFAVVMVTPDDDGGGAAAAATALLALPGWREVSTRRIRHVDHPANQCHRMLLK